MRSSRRPSLDHWHGWAATCRASVPRGRGVLAAVLVGALLTVGCSAVRSAADPSSAPAVAPGPVSATVTKPSPPSTERATPARPSPSPSRSPSAAPVSPSPSDRSTTSPSSAAPARGFHELVGLGDSVPAASACDCPGFVSGSAKLLSQTGRRVTAVNLAVPGATSSDLLHDLSSPHERSVIATSDVVVLEIGANDMNVRQLGDTACTDLS
ncbi:SGNH/GDSL hydrolase family protein [Nakamurella sp. A5-74]|uniref:SGNH/GDSL hydrolase family protein n=1 Tax=Nakamurella sp. A5-74 TaxID=3158264 RepID=A0AAU8DIV8_9ACTN